MSKPFSVAGAKESVDDLFNALPKTRQLDHIGALNEAHVVINKLADLAKIQDVNEPV